MAAPAGGYEELTLATERGEVQCRSYAAPGARRGAVWLGGVGGGFDSPARDLFPRLASELRGLGVSSLRVRFREPAQLAEAVEDALAATRFLEEADVERIALVGHSFGAAVAIAAAARAETARTVVALATQAYGTDAAAELAPRCSLLVVHGTADEILPHAGAELVFERARDPKRLVLYEGAGHGLDEAADQVHELVRVWILAETAADEPA